MKKTKDKSRIFEDYSCYKKMEVLEEHPLKKILKGLRIKEPVLDVGCGNGVLLGMFKNEFSIGIDPSEIAINLCLDKGLNVILSELENFRSSIKFKSIICIGLIGSIPNKKNFMERLYQLLDNDGKIYISFGKKTFYKQKDKELELFTKEEFSKLMEEYNLKVTKFIGLNRLNFPIICSNVLAIVEK